MIQLSAVYSVAALKVLPGQLLFYLGIFSRGVFLKTVENSLPTPLYIAHRLHNVIQQKALNQLQGMDAI